MITRSHSFKKKNIRSVNRFLTDIFKRKKIANSRLIVQIRKIHSTVNLILLSLLKKSVKNHFLIFFQKIKNSEKLKQDIYYQIKYCLKVVFPPKLYSRPHDL